MALTISVSADFISTISTHSNADEKLLPTAALLLMLHPWQWLLGELHHHHAAPKGKQTFASQSTGQMMEAQLR